MVVKDKKRGHISVKLICKIGSSSEQVCEPISLKWYKLHLEEQMVAETKAKCYERCHTLKVLNTFQYSFTYLS